MTRRDKGQSRKSYDSSRRKLKKTLADIERTRLEQIRREKTKQAGLPKAVRRAILREQALPADRVCPYCLRTKLASRQWVVTVHNVLCLSCFRKEMK